jgi:hypothetical protein
MPGEFLMPINDNTVAEVQSSLWDRALPVSMWPKVEIFLGLAAGHVGLAIGARAVLHPSTWPLPWMEGAFSFLLFVLGGYLAMAGHRSHLYIFQVRTTAILLQEMRKGEKS